MVDSRIIESRQKSSFFWTIKHLFEVPTGSFRYTLPKQHYESFTQSSASETKEAKPKELFYKQNHIILSITCTAMCAVKGNMLHQEVRRVWLQSWAEFLMLITDMCPPFPTGQQTMTAWVLASFVIKSSEKEIPEK